MTYDLVLALGWTPAQVRQLTLDDLRGLTRAANRRDRRAAKGR